MNSKTINSKRNDVHGQSRWLPKLIESSRSKMSSANYSLMCDYNNNMQISSVSDTARFKNLSHFKILTIMLGKDWTESTENDYRSIVSKIMTAHGDRGKETGYSHTLKISLRAIVRFLITGARTKPEDGEVKEMKFLVLRKPKDKLTREDLPTDEEIQKLISICADSSRDKALFAVHAEAGTRISELLTMRIKDVTIDQFGAIIKVDGKTGVRPIRIVISVPFLTKWINNHPFKDNPESPLWIYICYGNTIGTSITYHGFNMILHKRLRQAGINRRITSHMFRHKEITDLATHLTEAESRMRHGWEKSSNMPSRYTHLNQQNLDDKMLRLKGIKTAQESEKQMLRNCVYCNIPHPIDSKFCEVCSRPLDVTEAMRLEEENKEKARALVNEVLRQKHSKGNLDEKLEKLEELNRRQSQEIELLKQTMSKLSKP